MPARPTLLVRFRILHLDPHAAFLQNNFLAPVPAPEPVQLQLFQRPLQVVCERRRVRAVFDDRLPPFGRRAGRRDQKVAAVFGRGEVRRFGIERGRWQAVQAERQPRRISM